MAQYFIIEETRTEDGHGQLTLHLRDDGSWSICRSAELKGWGGVDHSLSIPPKAQFDAFKILMLKMVELGVKIDPHELRDKLKDDGHILHLTHGDSF